MLHEPVTDMQICTVWRKILTGENIDEFLSIRQHFPYQNFPLIISFAVCMPDHFFVQGVIASYSICAHAILFPVHANIYKWKNSAGL